MTRRRDNEGNAPEAEAEFNRSSASGSIPQSGRAELVRRIHGAIPQLSVKQGQLARLFLEDQATVSFATAAEIGEMTGVSAATVVRFAQLLGYDGFQELKDSLRGELRHNRSFLQELTHLAERPMTAPDELVRFVMGYEGENLAATTRSLDSETLVAVAKHLALARRIVLVGTGVSSSVLELLSFQLSRIGLPAAWPKNEVEVVTALADVGKDDVVIGVTFWRYLRSTSESIRVARKRGATTVVVVDNPWFPAADHADHILIVNSRNAGQGPSMVGATALVNTLIAAIILTDFDRFFRSTEKIDGAYGDAHLLLE